VEVKIPCGDIKVQSPQAAPGQDTHRQQPTNGVYRCSAITFGAKLLTCWLGEPLVGSLKAREGASGEFRMRSANTTQVGEESTPVCIELAVMNSGDSVGFRNPKF